MAKAKNTEKNDMTENTTNTNTNTTAAAPAPTELPTLNKTPDRVRQNGMTRPLAGTKTGLVWDIADALSASLNRPAQRSEVFEAYQKQVPDASNGTMSTQYSRWCGFHGVTEILREQRAKERAEASVAKDAEKAKKEAERAAAKEAKEAEKAAKAEAREKAKAEKAAAAAEKKAAAAAKAAEAKAAADAAAAEAAKAAANVAADATK